MAKIFSRLSAMGAGALLAFAVQPVQSADLLEVYDMARESDPQLQAALYNQLATRENRPQAIANFLPQINGQASKTEGSTDRTIGNMDSVVPDTDDEFWQISLRQALYSRDAFAQFDQAKAQVALGEADYDIAYQAFMIRVAESYFAVLTAIDSLAFSLAEERAIGRQLDQADQRFEVGLAAITDVHEAQARFDEARAAVIVAENTLDDAVEALTELTGEEINRIVPLEDELPRLPPDPSSPEAWVDLSLDNSPALASARFNARVAEAAIDRASAGHWPSLDLVVTRSNFVNGNQAFFDDFGNTAGVVELEQDQFRYGVELQVPIFSGGAVSSRTRQAGFQYESALEQLEQQRRATLRQTRNSFRGVLASVSEVEAREQALISARSAEEATTAGFDVGTRTIVDVLLSQQQLFQAQRNYSQSRHDYILNLLRLKRAAGVLERSDLVWVNRLLAQNQPLPVDAPEEFLENYQRDLLPARSEGTLRARSDEDNIYDADGNSADNSAP